MRDDEKRAKRDRKPSGATDPGSRSRESRQRPDIDRKELERRRKERAARKQLFEDTNREIKVLCGVVLLCFLVTIGYLGYFMVKKADGYKNNSYNSRRQALLETRYTRGNITAVDGTVLATTYVDEDGYEEREYPGGCTYAHAVGTTYNGVTGLESSAGSYLLNSHENIFSQIMSEVVGEKTVGDTVRSTLDAELQQVAHDALANRKGAVVVMVPETGEVRALVSKTDYDPNEKKAADEYEEGTLVNRVTQGLFSPGSTFKILTTLEYIRENPNSWSSFTYDCQGEYSSDGNSIHCYGGASHGELSLEEAFAHSCNGAYAQMGQGLNVKRFRELCEEMGFNRRIDGTNMTISKFALENGNSVGKVLQTAIGQGDTQITPMLNCMIAAAVANSGVMMKPRLIDSIYTNGGVKLTSVSSSAVDTVMTDSEAAILTKLMEACCEYGTGTAAAGDGYHVYGKTGSAEKTSGGETDAWFVGWAVSDSDPDRKLAISVIVEDGGSGGSAAAPIAGEVFREAFQE